MNCPNELPDLPGDEDEKVGHVHRYEVRQRRWQAVTHTGVNGLGFSLQQYSSATDQKRPYGSVHWTDND